MKFNELRITPDNQEMIIDVTIDKNQDTGDDYPCISKIIIDSQETFISTGPSSNPVYTYEVDNETTKVKRVSLTISNNDLSLENNLFFVYVIIDDGTGVEENKNYFIGVVYNTFIIFRDFLLPFIREVEKNCKIPTKFIDNILRHKALEIAIKTGNYETAVSYWNQFFANKPLPKPPICCCSNEIY